MYLLDTNVVSELRRRRQANPGVLAWSERADSSHNYLSCITLLEAEYGALLIERRDRVQGALMRRWVERDLVRRFAGRILSIDYSIALRCAALHVPDRRQERDALIAATALVHRMAVVTRNVHDFAPMGVRVINPWDDND
jgi:predicted nucleic acid-binding protein